MLDDLYFKWYYIKTTLVQGVLVALLWAGIVTYLVDQQLEAEDADREEV